MVWVEFDVEKCLPAYDPDSLLKLLRVNFDVSVQLSGLPLLFASVSKPPFITKFDAGTGVGVFDGTGVGSLVDGY